MQALRRLVWFSVLASLFGVLVGAALASHSVPAATTVHKLVPYPAAECLKEMVTVGGKKVPKNKIVGPACVDYRFGIYPERWTTLTSGKAIFDDPGYKNTFAWDVPETIGPGTAALSLSITALDKSGGRSCPGINVRGIGVKTGESADFILPLCADKINNPATSSGSRTLQLMPPGPGPATLIVGIAPGMQFFYRYVDASTTTPGCGRVTQSLHSRSRSATSGRVRADTKLVVDWRVSHHGVPDKGESPTLTNSSTVGSGRLTICAEAGTRSAVASDVLGVVEHTDTHVLPATGVTRKDVLKLVVKRGAWGEVGGNASVAFDVEVSESNDRECPVGTRGRLTLIQDDDRSRKDKRDQVKLRLCGASHTHTFTPGDDIDVVVSIARR